MKPLEGIKVVELGTHVAVPNATRCMADWGAEVIKVEGLTGDLWRYFGVNVSTPTTDEENPIFTQQNANKRLISINMKNPDGQKVMYKLLEDADVFVSNVRMKSLEKLGLSYEALKDKFPKLIYLHFTGYGYDGPSKNDPGFDVAAFWSRSGMLGDFSPAGSAPVSPGAGAGDAMVASSVLTGILAALIGRSKTGKGMRVTTSLFANGLWYNYGDVISTQPQYGNVRPAVEGRSANPFATSYRCKDDRWVFVCALEYNTALPKCMKVLGLEQYVDDPRFVDQATYQKHCDEFYAIVAPVFMTKTADEWVRLFLDADVVIAKVAKACEAYKDEQAWANGYLKEVTFKNGNKAVMPMPPVKFFGVENDEYHIPGPIGESTREILEEKGYTKEEIDALIEEKAIRG